MSLLFHDGFDAAHTSTGQSLATYQSRRGYTTTGGATATGRTGTGLACTNTVTLGFTLPAAKTTLVAGFAHFKATSSGTVAVLQFTQAGANQFCLCFDQAAGKVQVRRGNVAGTLVAETAAGVFVLNTWDYWEVKVLFSQTVGTYEVRKNGVTVLSGTGADTCNTTTAEADGLVFGLTSAGTIDDWYVLDTSGSVNNDFLGDVSSLAYDPDADGTSEQWALSTGSDSFALVDESPANDDTDYIESSTNGQVTRFTHEDVNSSDTIKAVTQIAWAKKTDASATSVRLHQRINGSSYNGSAVALGTSYAGVERLMETNPDTGSAWTPAIVNGAEFGVEAVI